MRRVEVTYIGHVQNVGFRFTVCQCAKDYPVSGFVRNEPDGSVFLTAEGPESELQTFLAAVADRMADYIREKRVNWSAASGAWSGFEIQH